jgi:hypothetical protein
VEFPRVVDFRRWDFVFLKLVSITTIHSRNKRPNDLWVWVVSIYLVQGWKILTQILRHTHDSQAKEKGLRTGRNSLLSSGRFGAMFLESRLLSASLTLRLLYRFRSNIIVN